MSQHYLSDSGYGLSIEENNVVTFQLGDNPGVDSTLNDSGFQRSQTLMYIPQWLNVDGYNVLARGENNLQCEEMQYNIKKNRIHPRLIDKQVKYLYGRGPHGYYEDIDEKGRPIKKWAKDTEVTKWFESWERNGMEASYKDFGMNVIRHFYTYYDFYVKMRVSEGSGFGYRHRLSGMELVENKNCRLTTGKKFDILREIPTYKDFKYITYGSWGFTTTKFKIYPRFNISEFSNYRYAAISHHRQSSVGDFYGCNETYEGTKEWIKGANDSPEYINSFLRNSLSAKIHIIIPHAWLEAKRNQIKALCNENEKRQKEGKLLLTYADIEIGTSYKESTLIKYTNLEIKKATEYLSGKRNQGKAFASYSFRTSDKEEERWRFETIDLKYKEYIEAMILVDKRVDQVMASSSGLDPSLIGIMQDGVVSKSGADIYYNIIVYLMTLTPDDEKCAEPYNIALQINFPELYSRGFRYGFYREMPSRQEEISVNNRLNAQQA